MSAYLLALLMTIWEWVLAPPLHWLGSLSIEWQFELGALLVLAVFSITIIENLFIGRELSGEWWSERKRHREWFRIGSMEPREFHAVVTSLRRKAEKETRLAERLQGRGVSALMSQILQRAVWRRQVRAEALHNEADRLEGLWRAIEKERENADSAETRTVVLQLMRRLLSADDRTSSAALAELKRKGNSFSWESLAPRGMGPPEREKLTKVLRLMAGTSNVDEARNALRTALRMLQEGGWSRHWGIA
jgi:hypothetical protein